jgi:hypothetical protein
MLVVLSRVKLLPSHLVGEPTPQLIQAQPKAFLTETLPSSLGHLLLRISVWQLVQAMIFRTQEMQALSNMSADKNVTKTRLISSELQFQGKPVCHTECASKHFYETTDSEFVCLDDPHCNLTPIVNARLSNSYTDYKFRHKFGTTDHFQCKADCTYAFV